LIEKRLSKCANKNAATALKTCLIVEGCIFARLLQTQHPYTFFYCQSTMHKRMAEKGDFLSAFWLSLHARYDQRKIAKFDSQVIFDPQ